MQYNNRLYKEQSVNTMTKGEMLLLLYNEIIKRLTKAKICCSNKEYETFDDELCRAQEIIIYFMQSLDRKYPISSDLFKLYDFFSFELARCKAARNTEIIDEVMPLITELRDSWKEADKLSNGMRLTANGQ